MASLFYGECSPDWPDSIDTSEAVVAIVVPRAFMDQRGADPLSPQECGIRIVSRLPSRLLAELLGSMADVVGSAAGYPGTDPEPGGLN